MTAARHHTEPEALRDGDDPVNATAAATTAAAAAATPERSLHPLPMASKTPMRFLTTLHRRLKVLSPQRNIKSPRVRVQGFRPPVPNPKLHTP